MAGGQGWINLTPGVPTELVDQPRPGLLGWLSGAPDQIAPLATWMPSEGSDANAGRLGVLHARGRLHREGVAGLAGIRPSWRLRQDHARRGLLFDIPSASDEEVAEGRVALVDELATVPTTGRYLAEVFVRS